MTPETTKLRFTFAEIRDAHRLQYGYCLVCRAVRGCCEPDARDYRCDECGERAVYGPHWLEIARLVGGGAP